MSDFTTKPENTMRNVAEQGIAFECLTLANNPMLCTQEIIDRAEAFLGFVTGRDVQTPREQINAALDQANVI